MTDHEREWEAIKRAHAEIERHYNKITAMYRDIETRNNEIAATAKRASLCVNLATLMILVCASMLAFGLMK